MESKARAILGSLLQAPLLVEDLEGAPVFDRSLLELPAGGGRLNFNQKLGHLYEQALESLIDATDALECLASHLQVFDAAGRTLGEMDFVLLDRLSGRHIHLELAVKFYLAQETAEGWQFPGPDPKDNWPRKLDRMGTHQFLLSQSPEARTLLQSRFGIESIETQQLIYGALFLPIACEGIPRHPTMAADARFGRWLYVGEWSQYFDRVDEVWLIPKSLWPVPLSDETIQLMQVVNAEEIMSLARERCTMFALRDSEEPIFLVPDSWPSAWANA